jgi:hypothetical protein
LTGATGPTGPPGDSSVLAFAHLEAYNVANSWGGNGTKSISTEYDGVGYYTIFFFGNYPAATDVDHLVVLSGAVPGAQQPTTSAGILFANSSEIEVRLIITAGPNQTALDTASHIAVFFAPNHQAVCGETYPQCNGACPADTTCRSDFEGNCFCQSNIG